MTEPAEQQQPPADSAHPMNAADAAALAQAGAQAIAEAPAGTDQATLKRIVREAVKEEADERGVTDAERIATASAAATIAQLEARGAFNPPEQQQEQQQQQQVPPEQQQQPPVNPAPQPDAVPQPKKTLAERMLRG